MQLGKRPFRLGLYLVLVFGLSWPFQLAYVVLGDPVRPILLLSMVMAGVGTYIAGRYVFGDGFTEARWRWGRPAHYAGVFGLTLFLWLLPIVLEHLLGIRRAVLNDTSGAIASTFFTSFAITLMPALGEEFAWRGYLLPRLLQNYSVRQALLLHGFITWLWHLPFIVTLGLNFGGSPAVGVPIVMTVSVIPTVMHAIVFAYIWAGTRSLAVVTVYHSAFDEVRDTLEATVGFGPLSANWQMAVLTILGALLLWKSSWRCGSRPGS